VSLAVAQVDQRTNLEPGIPRLENALVASNPEKGEFQFELAEAYWKSGRKDDAIRFYRKALLLSPEHMALRHNLSVALSESGRIDEAVKVLLGALDVSPNDSKSLNNLACPPPKFSLPYQWRIP
jgi:tetratricopeptide (TPR) repeat protein